MKHSTFEIPAPYCIATQDSFTYKAKNNMLFIGLLGLCYFIMLHEIVMTHNTLYFVGCFSLLVITRNPLQTKLNYIKGMDKTPYTFSINLGIMRIIILDGHIFSPPTKIAQSVQFKLNQFTSE